MKFVADDEALEVEFSGQTYSVRYPGWEEHTAFERAFSSEEESEKKAKVLFGFLAQLGLPETASTKMSMRKLLSLIETVAHQEKKA